jgi:hypothetical protein
MIIIHKPMILRWMAPFGVAIFLIGWNRDFEQWQILYTILTALILLLMIHYTASSRSLPEPSESNVLSLDKFRRQRQVLAFEKNRSGLQNIFESQYFYEAEWMASMLEAEGVTTHVFNRHNASILIHPMGEMQVKVLVPGDEMGHTKALIEDFQNSITPEDSSIA